MPNSSPPLVARAHTNLEDGGVDSGWSSLPPAPRGTDASSGVQPLPSQRRAEGTLLGVAPPRSPAALPSRRNPVIVHSGLSTVDSGAPASTHIPVREAALPIPTAPTPALEPTVDVQAVPQPMSLTAAPEPRLEHDARPVPFEQEVAPVLKPPVAASVTALRQEKEPPLGLLQALALPVRWLGVELPVWVVLVPLLVSLLAACVIVAFAAGSRRVPPPSIVALPGPAPIAATAVPSAQPTVETKAIEAKTPELRTAAEVVALAELAADKKREAAARFSQALLQTPTSLQKKSTVADLRRLVSDPVTAPQTLAAVASLPGPIGPDLLYEVWSGTPNKTEATELARALLSSTDVRSKASEALSLALQLRASGTCGDVGALLERAKQVGDKRSVGPLAKWKRKGTCAAASQRDCCSSDAGKDIAATIDALKSRRAPFEGT